MPFVTEWECDENCAECDELCPGGGELELGVGAVVEQFDKLTPMEEAELVAAVVEQWPKSVLELTLESLAKSPMRYLDAVDFFDSLGFDLAKKKH